MSHFVNHLDKDIFTVSKIFSPDECAALIERAESFGFQEATVSLTSGAVMMKDVRNNDRVNFEDFDLASELFEKVLPFVPAEIEGWAAVRLNERFRYYRYDVGQQFKRHKDGIVKFESGEESRLTFLIYLNEGYEGGETIFSDYVFEGGESRREEIRIVPHTGMGLFFAHRRWHEGAALTAGRKYVLRSDVVYRQP